MVLLYTADGWQREMLLPAVLIPRVGDVVLGPDGDRYHARHVTWRPFGDDDDPRPRVEVALARLGTESEL